jgi:hypothetical protein
MTSVPSSSESLSILEGERHSEPSQKGALQGRHVEKLTSKDLNSAAREITFLINSCYAPSADSRIFLSSQYAI